MKPRQTLSQIPYCKRTSSFIITLTCQHRTSLAMRRHRLTLCVESSLETPLPILPSTTYGQTNTPASPEKKVSTSPRGFRRSSKPTSLTLRKSNGLTQDSHTLSKQIRAAEVPVKLESTASPFQSSSRSRSDVDKFSQPSELRKASFSTIVREKKLPAPPPGLQTVGAFEALATAPAPVFGNAQKGWALREPASASAQTSQTAKSLPTLSTLAARLRDEGDEDDEDPFDDIIDELISERFEDEDLANSPPSSPEDMKNVVMNIFGKRKPSATPKTDVPAPPPSPPQHDRAARKESNAGNQLTKVVSPQNYPPTPPTLPATPTDLEPIDLDSKRLDEMMQGDSEITIMASPTAVINAGDNGLAQMHAAFAAYKSQVEGPQQLQTLETLKPSVYTPTGSSISGPVKQPTPPSPASSYASAHASISSLINPQPGDGYVSPVKNSQLRCHGDHRQWWGPKRNGGRGACQLCFTTGAPAPTPADAAADDDTAAKPEFFQCVLCALWVCTPCHKAVELAMGRTGRPRLAPPSPLPPRGMLTPSRPVGPPGFARSPMSERPPPRRSPLGPSPTPGYGPGGMGRPPGSSSGPPPPRSSSKRPPGSSSGPPPPSSASGSSPGSSSGPTPAASSGPPPAPSAGSNPAPIKPSLSVRLGLAGQHAVRGQPPPVPAPAST